MYLPVISLQPRGYIAEWFRFFRVVVKGPKGWLPAPEIACDFWYGSWGPPNVPNFSPMAKSYIHTECYCTARQIWTKDVWKRCTSEDGCSFPPNIFAPTPKITPKPHFGGSFNAKPIILVQRALRKSHVNGATKLKLYSYIGIGKYLGCVKLFPLGGVQGTQGPLM